MSHVIIICIINKFSFEYLKRVISITLMLVFFILLNYVRPLNKLLKLDIKKKKNPDRDTHSMWILLFDQ